MAEIYLEKIQTTILEGIDVVSTVKNLYNKLIFEEFVTIYDDNLCIEQSHNILNHTILYTHQNHISKYTHFVDFFRRDKSGILARAQVWMEDLSTICIAAGKIDPKDKANLLVPYIYKLHLHFDMYSNFDVHRISLNDNILNDLPLLFVIYFLEMKGIFVVM